MFDDSVSTVYSSIWASMNSWFTPTVLFVLLNVMIGTIAFTSSLANKKQNHTKQHQQEEDYSQNQSQQQEDYSQNQPQQRQSPKLARSPSLLQRIKSINFYNYRSQEPIKDYNFDQEETPFEPPTHYIFEPAHEHTTVEQDTNHTQYIFNQSHQEKLQKAETHQENVPEIQTQQYLFQQTHEEKLGNIEHDFHFEETLTDKSTQYNFQHTHEEKLKDMENLFDFQQIEEENEDDDEGLDEVYSRLSEHHVSRSISDTKPSAGEAQAKLPSKMKKSASMKSPFAHFEEEAIVETRRPATTREKNSKTSDGDTEVDAKADDFIYRFKQQLKLQRVDSILRYKEMIGRGS